MHDENCTDSTKYPFKRERCKKIFRKTAEVIDNRKQEA